MGLGVVHESNVNHQMLCEQHLHRTWIMGYNSQPAIQCGVTTSLKN
jgi:hypothetical protein